MNADRGRTVNSVYIDASADAIWWYVATAEGWKHFLSDIATYSGAQPEIAQGDELTLVIGELTNRAVCAECVKPELIRFDERYTSILPDGSLWEYNLRTSFAFEPIGCGTCTKVTVTVEGYTEDETMQWVRECGETGWRQSLFHLKNTIELGLDLRNSIFNYPRLGVMNYTATAAQLEEQGLADAGIRGNFIATVYPNSPASRAGLHGGVIVTSLGGIPVPTYHDFVKALSRFYGTNAPADIVFYERGERHAVTADLTYDDQFTGMIDPNEVSLDEISVRRRKLSAVKEQE
ncbi:hypothetical protein [Paenibacillus chitinolyticus]|uniref:hypothetical protein n=1 Tax=Paenibacillus chitinolyticus TaxID=79263 RepID=UPI00366AC29B